MLRTLYRCLLPRSLRAGIHKRFEELVHTLKRPTMVYGFRDSSGAWRPRTRISDTVFFTHQEHVTIEDNVFVWHYSILDGTGGLLIEEGAQVGAWVGLFTHSSHVSVRLYGRHYQDVPEDQKKGYVIQPVRIGRYAFIGARALILPGVTVGAGAIVSAAAVVSKNVGPFEIVSGNPAEVVGDARRLDARYVRDRQIREWYEEWQKS